GDLRNRERVAVFAQGELIAKGGARSQCGVAVAMEHAAPRPGAAAVLAVDINGALGGRTFRARVLLRADLGALVGRVGDRDHLAVVADGNAAAIGAGPLIEATPVGH